MALNAQARASVCQLSRLPLSQAQSLIQRLGNPDVIDPRIEIPFDLWGALITHDGWRQQLVCQRRGLPNQQSVRQWLQSGVSEIGQHLGWVRVAFESNNQAVARNTAMEDMKSALTRDLLIEGTLVTLWIFPVPDPLGNAWRFELRSPPNAAIPPGARLRLLTEELQAFEGNEVIAGLQSDRIYIEVALEPEEGIVWAIDPVPKDYIQEILRF